MKTIDDFLPAKIFTRRFPSLDSAREGTSNATERLRTLLVSLPEGVLERPTEPGKWSPAQVADHLSVSTELLIAAIERMLDSEMPPVEMPRGQLTDEGTAIAPPEGQPREGRELADLTADLERVGRELIETLDRVVAADLLDGVCVVHSFFGPLTASHCVQLTAWHLEHHRRALQRTLGEEGVGVG